MEAWRSKRGSEGGRKDGGTAFLVVSVSSFFLALWFHLGLKLGRGKQEITQQASRE